MKILLQALSIIVISFIISTLLFSGNTGPNSPLIRFGDLLVSPIGGLILLDPIQYLYKKFISKKELKPIFSKENAIGIFENYFVYWILFGVLRVTYWVIYDVPHSYTPPFWRH